MASRFRSARSTEAPMDYQFTSRPSIKPVWAKDADDPSTPRKRAHDDANPPTPSFPDSSPAHNFGSNQDVPFIFFQSPPGHTTTQNTQPWVPPSMFSPQKAFPQPTFQEEIKDVDMTDASPHRPEEKSTGGGRMVAAGAMRRVYRSRQQARARLPSRSRGDGSGSESDEEESGQMTPRNQTTSNHYTLNMPSPAPPQSDLPYILLGYLQFFFNFSLILLFLYLVVQFILTVQRDVEHRVSEYSMDIVQEISLCALQYKNNLCATNVAPAMAQQCANWETCMSRDPTIVGRAKVGAELIAEVVNSFVEPISWKTLAFTLTSLSFLTLFVNTLLSLYRSKHHPGPAPPLHQPSFPIPPGTPYPPHQFGGYLSPAPTPSWGRTWKSSEEELQTPTRRRRLEGGVSAKIK